MKLKNKIRRRISLIISAVIVVSITGGVFPIAVSADDNPATPPRLITDAELSGLSTSLQNGNFEIPETDLDTPWYMMAPTETEYTFNNTIYHPTPANYSWKTTAFDQIFELAVETHRDYTTQYHLGQAVTNPDTTEGHKNVAELVAEERASLYQNIATTPGARLGWELAHIARRNSSTEGQAHYKDIMALFIGRTPRYELKKENPNVANEETKDIFMWMGKLLEAEARDDSNFAFDKGTSNGTYHKKAEYTVYASPNAARDILNIVEDTTNGKSNPNDYRNYFSQTKTAECTEEWKCWVIGDTADKWGEYGGSYIVPEGQKTTTFAFTALTGTANKNVGKKGFNEGNLLDGVKFSIAYPLQVTSTGGGSGTVQADMDADGNQNINVTVDDQNPYNSHYYTENKEVTITATEESGYSFIGAIIDEVFKPASEFTKDGATYTKTVTMDKAHYVKLIFIGQGKVVYDPNGGTFNCSKENTVVSFVENGGTSGGYGTVTKVENLDTIEYNTWYNPVGDAEPPVLGSENGEPKSSFIGWHFLSGDNSSLVGMNNLITSEHTVQYHVPNTDDPETDLLNLKYKTGTNSGEQDFLAQVGITFIAEYDYLQRALAVTVDKNDKEANIIGGTVNLTIEKANKSSEHRDVTKNDETDTTDTHGRGQLCDKVTMTAAARTGYTFIGWYEKHDDGSFSLKRQKADLTYEVDTCHTYFALFTNNEKTYVSFVAESQPAQDSEGNTAAAETPFSRGSHVKEYVNGVENILREEADRIGGNDRFGNTISTGFVAETGLNTGENPSNIVQWTITIPTGADSNTYVKINKSQESGDNSDLLFVYEGDPVLRDNVTNDSYFNEGSIHKVTGNNVTARLNSVPADDSLLEYYGLSGSVSDSDTSSDEVDSFTDEMNSMGEAVEAGNDTDNAVSDFTGTDEMPDAFYENLGEFENPFEAQTYSVAAEGDHLVIRLRKSLGTTITGTATIRYGLVIDNLYAPEATAAVILREQSNVSYQDVDIMNERVNATTSEGYRHDDGNEYYKYEHGLNTASN